jgi:hypothetical protein
MGTKRWDRPGGTCRAIVAVYGSQVVVCHCCRRYVDMPKLDVPFHPCPFVCQHCGSRGEIKDASDAPSEYPHQSWTVHGAAFLSPKLRWKPTR